MSLGRSAYSFCFFFGPGLLFDLGFSSTPSPSSLFMPVLGPVAPFWFASITEGTDIPGGLGAGDNLISVLMSTTVGFSSDGAVAIGVGVDEALGGAGFLVGFS